MVVAIVAAVALSYEPSPVKVGASALMALLALPNAARAEQKRIYIPPDDHTDYLRGPGTRKSTGAGLRGDER